MVFGLVDFGVCKICFDLDLIEATSWNAQGHGLAGDLNLHTFQIRALPFADSAWRTTLEASGYVLGHNDVLHRLRVLATRPSHISYLYTTSTISLLFLS